MKLDTNVTLNYLLLSHELRRKILLELTSYYVDLLKEGPTINQIDLPSHIRAVEETGALIQTIVQIESDYL